METDEIIQQIETDIADLSAKMELDDAIMQTVEKYEKYIITRFKDAKKVIDTYGWD